MNVLPARVGGQLAKWHKGACGRAQNVPYYGHEERKRNAGLLGDGWLGLRGF